jgi:hypothetical protein
MIGSLQLLHCDRKLVPQAKQYFERSEVHIGSGVVPGSQHWGQYLSAVTVSREICLTTASKYSWGIPRAAANPERHFWLSRDVAPDSILRIVWIWIPALILNSHCVNRIESRTR